MAAVRLVCWNPDLAQNRVRLLEDAGIRVDASPLNPGGLIGHFRENMPAAVLIDLDRLPSHGREVAVALRNSKVTRHLPIVFAGGVAEKIQRIRHELPDAFFTEWQTVPGVLKKALAHAPKAPVQPVPHMQRYAGSSLAKKLGLKPNTKVAVLGAPDDFQETLGEVPESIEFQKRITRQTLMAIWFVRSLRELDNILVPESGALWIVHPKQSSRYKIDFNQNDVRAAGLAAGLVDYKVCSVDADWSGLKFGWKRSPRTNLFESK